MTWGKYFWLPIWAMTHFMLLFMSASHPWQREAMNLDSWHRKGTDLARIINTVFWTTFLSVTALAWLIISRHLQS